MIVDDGLLAEIIKSVRELDRERRSERARAARMRSLSLELVDVREEMESYRELPPHCSSCCCSTETPIDGG